MNQLSPIHDLLVIGGGINGTGIAADAAGRQLDVVLCEMNDLASATSSASTKLIHGGLRYLEQYEFKLVREALGEREVLLRNAPHLITPMRFRLPHMPHLRPKWMIRAGLFLYDSLSRRVSLPASGAIKFTDADPLAPHLKDGFEYSDAWVDDARLVVALAKLAQEKGADIRVRRKCVAAKVQNGIWRVDLLDKDTGKIETVLARAIVNAAGPWVQRLFAEVAPSQTSRAVRLVKGCHIVVPRIHPGEETYMLQNDDGRVVFVIPYLHDYSLVGTTEEDFVGDPTEAVISDWERDYLVALVNKNFRQQIAIEDICHTFAGVRPLLADDEDSASKVSRDYLLELSIEEAPILTVYGGKITTYRRLAQSAMAKLRKVFPDLGGDWTESASLPGAQFESYDALLEALGAQYPWVDSDLLKRWASAYGSKTFAMLEGVRDRRGLGEDIGHGLSACEVEYLCEHEWAVDAEDILWRRSKLGMKFGAVERAKLDGYLAGRRASDGF